MSYFVAILVACIYGLGNLFLMLWLGLTNHSLSIPSGLFGMGASYVLFALAIVHIPLWWADRKARTAALISLCPPWILIGQISWPQAEGHETALWIGAIFLGILIGHGVLENRFMKKKPTSNAKKNSES